MTATVLIVDDDRDLTSVLDLAFRQAGFDPMVANTTPAALHLFDTAHPDLVLLDIHLGTWSGLDLLSELRRSGRRVPIVLLTALDAEDDKVRGLELGADDYVTKPFGHRELVARVRAHLRRVGQEPPEGWGGPRELQVGPLGLSVARHSASLDGRPLDLTVTEFRLLHALMREPGTVVPTIRLLKQVWGYDVADSADVVRVTVHRLRRKLGDDAAQPRLIHTVAGVGIMLRAEEDDPSASGDT